MKNSLCFLYGVPHRVCLRRGTRLLANVSVFVVFIILIGRINDFGFDTFFVASKKVIDVCDDDGKRMLQPKPQTSDGEYGSGDDAYDDKEPLVLFHENLLIQVLSLNSGPTLHVATVYQHFERLSMHIYIIFGDDREKRRYF